jgi:hypothetical protein
VRNIEDLLQYADKRIFIKEEVSGGPLSGLPLKKESRFERPSRFRTGKFQSICTRGIPTATATGSNALRRF